MTRKHILAVVAASVVISACSNSNPLHSLSTAPSLVDPQSPADVGKFKTRNSDPCGDVTYVGPIRPISVHGSTANISWLGNDGATRGYEVQFERLDVSNVWLFADSTVVNPPEIERHFRTEGTYRVRVRGLFCNDQVGGFTDWVVFSTDGEPDAPAPPPICLTSVDGCYPPPPQCLVECPPPPCTHYCDEGDHDNGHGNDGDHHDDDNPGNDPGDPGHDGPPPCNLHITKNPHDGDHNDDGHNDCGHGHH